MSDVSVLVEKVIARVRYLGGSVTFVEIEDCLGESVAKGDLAFTLLEPYENIVLWSGMSEDFVAVISAIQQSRALDIKPTEWLTYALDGGALKLPIVTGKRKYKTLHWLPVCFHMPKPAKKVVGKSRSARIAPGGGERCQS